MSASEPGICLPHYTRASAVVGIDLSEPMLRKARQRAAELRLSNVESLEVMDAEPLEFPDGCFDVVVAQYVVNTVPHPEAALDEFARVLKPGGEIVLINRIGADAGLRHALEAGLAPAGHWLGWRPEFRWTRAPPGAPAGPLLAHPLRQDCHRLRRPAGAGERSSGER